jgi:hypothetical protein
MSALEQLLLEHFKSINTGSATQPFLAFELGTPIPDTTFRNPADTTKYSPALALEYLSHRANAVPSIQQHLFVETSNTVDGLYEILLLGSTPVDTDSMELLGAIKRSAQSAFDMRLQAESGISEQFRPTHGDPVDWYDQSAATNWTTIHVSKADKPATPSPTPLPSPTDYSKSLLQWSVAPVEFRSQLGRPAAELSIGAIAAMQVVPSARETTIQTAPEAFQRANLSRFTMRAAPFVAEAEMTQVNPAFAATIANTQFRREVAFRHHAGFGLGGDAPPVPPTPPAPPPQPEVSSDAFSIDVEISIVKLRRPWLSDGLLNLKGWFVPSAAKGSFSDGTGVGDQGVLPLLPVACVLIRNLSIHAQWSEDDQKNLENSTHLGAFGLQGRSYDRNSATLKVDGMQSVAWICDPLPVLPPADPPAS